ncbi:MAG: hypothetical protein CMJ31_13855 [Phycisphaerae bacterium]|nr:hypothetical protein [Phycisphaerae bacterium]
MTTHVVIAGECLATIAERYNFPKWRTIYDAPENEELRKKRPNPNVIYPGDEVVIPEKREKRESRADGQRHRFKIPIPKWELRLRVLDEVGDPVVEAPFRLFIDGDMVLEDKTDDQGELMHEVRATARIGRIETLGESIDLRLGHLDPVSRVRGVQQRLNNLGFRAGPADGLAGPKTTSAVTAFQASRGLDRTGRIDHKLREKLLAAHDVDDQTPPAEDEDRSPDLPDAGEEGGATASAGGADVVVGDIDAVWDESFVRPRGLTPLNLNSPTDLIRGTQERLTALGFNPGPIDGLDGPQTQSGVRAFQGHCRDHAGYPDPKVIDSGPVDGIVGPLTKAALESWYGA